MTEPKPRPRKRTTQQPASGTVDIDTTPELGKNPPSVPLGVMVPVDIDLDTPILAKNPPKTYRLRRPR